MGALFSAFVPILLLMALPLLIPAIAVAIDFVREKISPRKASPAEEIVEDAWKRAAVIRHETEREHAEILAARAQNPS